MLSDFSTQKIQKCTNSVIPIPKNVYKVCGIWVKMIKITVWELSSKFVTLAQTDHVENHPISKGKYELSINDWNCHV